MVARQQYYMSQQQQPHQMVKATEREGERENLLIAVIIVGPRSKSLYCIIPMPQFIMSPSLLLCGPLQYCNHSRKESLIELDVTHVYMFLLSSPFSAHLVGSPPMERLMWSSSDAVSVSDNGKPYKRNIPRSAKIKQVKWR